MRPKHFELTGATVATPWVPVNYHSQNDGLSVVASYQSGGSGATLTLQKTVSNLGRKLKCSVSQSTTTTTVTFEEPHGLSVGDTFALQGTGDSEWDTQHSVAAVSSTTVVTTTDAGRNSSGALVVPTSRTLTGDGYAVPIVIADSVSLTADTVATVTDIVTAVRGVATTLTGSVNFDITKQG